MTDNEMRRMQEEALRRTQEMQRRANAIRFASEGASDNSRQNTAPVNRADPAENALQEQHTPHSAETAASHERQHTVDAVTAAPAHANPGHGSADNIRAPEHQDRKTVPPMTETYTQHPSGGIFEVLFRDKEKTLILGLILLLMDEKTDNTLLMALMYLLI